MWIYIYTHTCIQYENNILISIFVFSCVGLLQFVSLFSCLHLKCAVSMPPYWDNSLFAVLNIKDYIPFSVGTLFWVCCEITINKQLNIEWWGKRKCQLLVEQKVISELWMILPSGVHKCSQHLKNWCSFSSLTILLSVFIPWNVSDHRWHPHLQSLFVWWIFSFVSLSAVCTVVCLPVYYRSAHTFFCVNIHLRALKQNQNRKEKKKEEAFTYIVQDKSPCQWLTCLWIVLDRILKVKQFNTNQENYSNI